MQKREVDGLKLMAAGHVEPIDSSTFAVKSSSEDKRYVVEWAGKRWTCTCEDFLKRKRKCKHIYAVCYFLTLRDVQVGVQKVGKGRVSCPICGSPDSVIKDGLEESKSGFIQRYYCKNCKRGFTARTGFEGMHGQALAILLALDLYYRGLSLRNIAEHLKSVYGISVSHSTVYGWIKRYVDIIGKYMDKLQVKTSERWHADDTVVRVKGRHMLVWGMLDGETRLLIARHISESKDVNEAYALLEKALGKSQEKPSEIVTDAAPQYATAIDKKFGEELKDPIIHVQAAINTPLTNNKMERFCRTLKQRYKTVNSFHSKETAETFLKGYEIFYNAIKPHKALGNKPPLMAIGVIDKAKWISIIQKIKNGSNRN